MFFNRIQLFLNCNGRLKEEISTHIRVVTPAVRHYLRERVENLEMKLPEGHSCPYTNISDRAMSTRFHVNAKLSCSEGDKCWLLNNAVSIVWSSSWLRPSECCSLIRNTVICKSDRENEKLNWTPKKYDEWLFRDTEFVRWDVRVGTLQAVDIKK